MSESSKEELMSKPTTAGGAAAGPSFKDARDASSTLFDLRFIIGGLFTVYGVILVVASRYVSNTKAGGMDINLWLGLAMLILGVSFLVWAWRRPLVLEPVQSVLAQEGLSAGSEPGREPGREPGSEVGRETGRPDRG